MDFDRNVTFTIGLTSACGAVLSRDVVLQDVVQVLEAHGINGFTVTDHTGYWKGEQEASISVSILARYGDVIVVTAPAVAKELATECLQDCVLWSIAPAIAGLAYSNTEV
jgi:hypothetical protein